MLGAKRTHLGKGIGSLCRADEEADEWRQAAKELKRVDVKTRPEGR